MTAATAEPTAPEKPSKPVDITTSAWKADPFTHYARMRAYRSR